jgi:hypothetical protein
MNAANDFEAWHFEDWLLELIELMAIRLEADNLCDFCNADDEQLRRVVETVAAIKAPHATRCLSNAYVPELEALEWRFCLRCLFRLAKIFVAWAKPMLNSIAYLVVATDLLGPIAEAVKRQNLREANARTAAEAAHESVMRKNPIVIIPDEGLKIFSVDRERALDAVFEEDSKRKRRKR